MHLWKVCSGLLAYTYLIRKYIELYKTTCTKQLYCNTATSVITAFKFRVNYLVCRFIVMVTVFPGSSNNHDDECLRNLDLDGDACDLERFEASLAQWRVEIRLWG